MKATIIESKSGVVIHLQKKGTLKLSEVEYFEQYGFTAMSYEDSIFCTVTIPINNLTNPRLKVYQNVVDIMDDLNPEMDTGAHKTITRMRKNLEETKPR